VLLSAAFRVMDRKPENRSRQSAKADSRVNRRSEQNYRHDWAITSEATAHYLPFWSRGIGVDVLSSDMDFSAYALVIAPKLFLLKPGLSTRLRQYVEAGGTLVFTHLGGLVNETGSCFTDGAPGNGVAGYSSMKRTN